MYVTARIGLSAPVFQPLGASHFTADCVDGIGKSLLADDGGAAATGAAAGWLEATSFGAGAQPSNNATEKMMVIIRITKITPENKL
jgi:hypothetical protein